MPWVWRRAGVKSVLVLFFKDAEENIFFKGTLLIVPSAGALCAQSWFFGGWPSIFYVSAFTGLFFAFIYIVVGADKPSKQQCISASELKFITQANTNEDFGLKRMQRKVPWKQILTSAPVWAALISVVCHEFPLMTMIMFLPRYLHYQEEEEEKDLIDEKKYPFLVIFTTCIIITRRKTEFLAHFRPLAYGLAKLGVRI